MLLSSLSHQDALSVRCYDDFNIHFEPATKRSTEEHLESLREIARDCKVNPKAQDIHIFGCGSRYRYVWEIYENGPNGSLAMGAPRRKADTDSVADEHKGRAKERKKAVLKEALERIKGKESDVKPEDLPYEVFYKIGATIEKKLKRKYPYISEEDTRQTLLLLDHPESLAPYVQHYMEGKARHNEHKRVASLAKDAAMAKGKQIHGVDRLSRSARRLLELMKSIDKTKVDSGRWVLETLTAAHDVRASYIKLGNQVLKYLSSFLGDELFGFIVMETEPKRHLHLVYQVPPDATCGAPIKEDEREIWKQLADQEWARLLSTCKDYKGRPGIAIPASQDMALIQDEDDPIEGPQDGLAKVIAYVTKKANYVRELRKQGKHKHADRVEAKCDLDDHQLRLLNQTRDCELTDNYLRKTGKDRRGDDQSHINWVRTNIKKPGEHQYAVYNREEFERRQTKVEIELTEEEHFEALEEVIETCNRILAARGAKFRIPRKRFRTSLTSTMLTHHQIYECIRRAREKVKRRHEVGQVAA